MAEIDVWKEVRASDPPVDQLERQEDADAKAIDLNGPAFWEQMHRQYQGECGSEDGSPT